MALHELHTYVRTAQYAQAIQMVCQVYIYIYIYVYYGKQWAWEQTEDPLLWFSSIAFKNMP